MYQRASRFSRGCARSCRGPGAPLILRRSLSSRARYHGFVGHFWVSGRAQRLTLCGIFSASFASFLTARFYGLDTIPESWKVHADSHDEPFVLFRGRPINLGREGESLRAKSSDEERSLAPQRRVVIDGKEQDAPEDAPKNSWHAVTEGLSALGTSFKTLPDKLTNFILPDWAKALPGFITKLQTEFSMAPGSLAEEVWQEANDPESNPEIVWEAKVRISDNLCEDEQIFLHNRKLHTRHALARYLNVSSDEVHPEDVPIIAMCGSGGGLRALVAGSSSYLSAKEAGLFDCLTYTAGVSGSCWLQSLYFSSITGQSHDHLLRHLKHRLGVHIAYPPAAFTLTTSAPTNKYLLSGMIEKMRGVPEADFGIVDVYGLLLAARLFVPKGELQVTDDDLKLSNQRRFLQHGEHPLPIYTAVRHEIPDYEKSPLDDQAKRRKAQKEDWFQWFEFTPYEFWCEELMAGIPTWALGRRFENGHTSWRQNGLSLPEARLPLLLGIWGSAFCATLSHYYHEIQPLVKGLAGLQGVDQLMTERDEDLVKHHVIDPASLPNFAMGMKGMLPETVPASLFEEERLKLMDAGMSNNLPIYPLLRPGRDVDIIISFDNSADARQDNWLHVVEGYARQRHIKGWPIGAGWPPPDAQRDKIAAELESAQASSDAEATRKIEEAAKKQAAETAAAEHKGEEASTDLTYCNLWVGSITERTANTGSDARPQHENGTSPPTTTSRIPSTKDDNGATAAASDVLSSDEAGICVIYFPLLANPAVPSVDPATAPYLSTWNFIYTPQQVDDVVALARANFAEGADQTRRAVRAVWERKRRLRLEREERQGAAAKIARGVRRREELRSGRGVGRKPGEGDHGDHFS